MLQRGDSAKPEHHHLVSVFHFAGGADASAVQAVILHNYLYREMLDRLGLREHIELNYQHSARISLCADSLLPVASNCTRKKDEHS